MPAFTAEQAAIVEQKHGNILVSAAAGSGKTTVMVERITKRIRQAEVDVSALLVLTFTDAAAANMKAKISKSLHDALRTANTPAERMHLNKQTLHLPYAKISTIHAFCLSVVREYAYLLDPEVDGTEPLDADFRTADAAESDELFSRAVESVMERYYLRLEDLDAEQQEADESDELLASDFSEEEKNEAADFLKLLDSYAGSKSDDAIKSSINQCYRFLRSMPDYGLWVDQELGEIALAAADFDQSRAAAILRRRLKDAITAQATALDEMTDLLSDPMTELLATSSKAGQEKNELLKAECLASVEAIRTLDQLLLSDPLLPYEVIQAQLERCIFPKVSRSKNNEVRTTVSDLIRFNMSAISGFYRTHKDAPRGTLPAYELSKAAIEDDLAAMYPVLRALFMLVLETDKRYTALKSEQAVIDFSDFEHLALALLRKPEVIQLYVNQIQEIYVDEYQDTSSIQNKIIEAVSQNNIFVVGDIKQSIYRFRHARPELFNAKMREYSTDYLAGTIHIMSQNFRSVGGILEAVNSVFERVMEERSGEINYQDGHALKAFHEDHPDVPQPVEFILIDKGQKSKIENLDGADIALTNRSLDLDSDASDAEDKDESQVELTAIEEEGRLIGEIIRREGYGYGHPIAAKFSDITILCMTHSHAKAISGELIRQGLPVSGEEESGYLEANELRLMEALIKLLGNELQDLPLLTCMRQIPVYGSFTDEELMEIKAYSLRHDSSRNVYEHYHEAVSYYETNGPDGNLRDRLKRFKTWIKSLREASIYLSLNELISLIYLESGLPEAVAAETEGEHRVLNLQSFQKWAADFEGRGRRGLPYFVRYLEEKRKSGVSISPFEDPDAEDNSIRVITFHKSKGLEFPLVFLVGLDRRLVAAGGMGSNFVNLSEKGGIAFQIRRPDRILSYPSIITQALQEEMNDAEFAESMRLLYVAMTRAEHKLYLLASPDRALDKQSSVFQKRLDSFRQRELGQDDLKWPANQRAAYDRRDLLKAATYADLIFMSQIASYPELYDHFSSGEAGSTVERGPWRFVNLNTGQEWPFLAKREAVVPEDEGDRTNETAEDVIETEIDELAFSAICRSYQERYPYQQATITPQKFAVSELKRRMQLDILNLGDADDHLAAEATDGKPLEGLSGAGINTQIDDWLSPAWMSKKNERRELAANERGTALHTALRFIDVAALRGKTIDDVMKALEILNEQTVLSDAELLAVLPYSEKLLAYVNSNEALEILEVEGDTGRVYREVPFTLAEPLRTFMKDVDGLSEDKVLIQGIIDLWYSRDGESVLLDYKSDVLSGSEEERIETLTTRYQLQLELYSRAIFAATGKMVKKRLIWSIPDARMYEIEKMIL